MDNKEIWMVKNYIKFLKVKVQMFQQMMWVSKKPYNKQELQKELNKKNLH